MILRPPISTRTATLFPSTTCFRSGGRRRSELASRKVEQLVEELPVPVDPADPQGPQLPCMTIALGRTNTSDAEEGRAVKLVGRPVDARRELDGLGGKCRRRHEDALRRAETDQTTREGLYLRAPDRESGGIPLGLNVDTIESEDILVDHAVNAAVA